jgi:hypothetical protein
MSGSTYEELKGIKLLSNNTQTSVLLLIGEGFSGKIK